MQDARYRVFYPARPFDRISQMHACKVTRCRSSSSSSLLAREHTRDNLGAVWKILITRAPRKRERERKRTGRRLNEVARLRGGKCFCQFNSLKLQECRRAAVDAANAFSLLYDITLSSLYVSEVALSHPWLYLHPPDILACCDFTLWYVWNKLLMVKFVSMTRKIRFISINYIVNLPFHWYFSMFFN